MSLTVWDSSHSDSDVFCTDSGTRRFGFAVGTPEQAVPSAVGTADKWRSVSASASAQSTGAVSVNSYQCDVRGVSPPLPAGTQTSAGKRVL